MTKPENYTPYHIHSDLSNGITNIDSITKFESYIDVAAEYNMKSFGFSEHGSFFAWLKKKEYIESKGMKYIPAIEAYLTEDDGTQKIYSAVEIIKTNAKKSLKRIKFTEYWQDENGQWVANVENKKEKTCRTCCIDIESLKIEGILQHKDNYHVVLIAKNKQGFNELLKVTSRASDRDKIHFYYTPRITFEELFNLSENVIVTSACLGGALHKGTATAKEKFLSFLSENKDRCFLEIQHHNCEAQIEYNRLLYKLSEEMGIPLIAGTDTHALNEMHMEGRKILQKAKDICFPDEDAWDLSFKSIDELIKAYEKQGSLPMDVVYEAINNTNVMADMVEPFTVDYSAKYPQLYTDSDKVFAKKIKEGIKSRKIDELPNKQKYYDRIEYEYGVYKHNGAVNFMLLEEDYKTEMRKQGVKYGYSRGSVSGSLIAYLLHITEIDSVKYNLNFERFMNKERVSLADIDTDWLSEDRKKVREYLYNKKGLYCCDIVTFNTIALKGSIRDVCRALYKTDDASQLLTPKWKKEYEKYIEESEEYKSQGQTLEMPADLKAEIDKVSDNEYLRISEKIIEMCENDEEGAIKKYPEVFKYVDLVNGVITSVGNHPSACIVSPVPVDENIGTFRTAKNEYPISVLNMKEIDAMKYVKLDILGLDNIGLIYKTCEAAGIPFATPDNIPPDDLDVWNSIKDDTTMIFQWESPSATAYLRTLMSDEVIKRIKEKNENFSYMDLFSIGNGAIRPAGASYRDNLAKGIYQDNGHKALNDFLAPTLGYLVYQEQIIEFLHKFCGFTMGEADIVRRHFSKKIGTDVDIPIIKDGGYMNPEKKDHYIKGFIQTMKEEYGVEKEEAEKIIVSFLQVIMDASDYLFSKNHSDPYSWIGYICGYLRYYYPLEFITTALNIFEDKEDKTLAIIAYAKKRGIKISPIKFRHSVAKYTFSKEDNTIFKGIASIKYMNATVADEIYALRNNKYNNFVELLSDLTKTTTKKNQLKILIELDFFEEFGNANYLTKIFELFQVFYNRVELKKSKAEELNIKEDTIMQFAGKETEKKYTKLNSYGLLNYLANNIKVKDRTLQEKIESQIQHLGFVNIIDDRYKGMVVVTEINTKYSPKLKVYSLKNGTTVDCKIQKRTFSSRKVEKGDILRILGTTKKPKVERKEDGTFEPISGTSELWLTNYLVVNNL